MNVWIVNHYALPPQSAGGTRHHDLASKLFELGHQVTIVASSFNHWSRTEEHLGNKEWFGGARYENVDFLWVKTPSYSGNLSRLFNMLVFSWRVFRGEWNADLRPPDVVIGSSPHLFGTLAARCLANRFRASFVMEVRDLWPQTLLDLGNLSRRHPLVKIMEWVEKGLYKRSNRIISLLPGAVEHIVLKGGRPEKVKWIPNGVDLAKIPFERKEYSAEVFEIVYAGSHGIANALDSIVMAAKVLEEEGHGTALRFRFYGSGPEKGRLQKMTKEFGLSCVVFEDPIPKSDVYQVLGQADAFVVCLKESGLYRYGISLNKIYDYLALARPVIFAGQSLNNPVADAGAGLVVPPEDPRALAEAVRKIAAMTEEERREMGDRGRAFIAEHHDTALLARSLEQVCLEALEG